MCSIDLDGGGAAKDSWGGADVEGEWRHGTFEGFAKGVSGDAWHRGTGISILVRFEASNVVYAIDEGEM
jgi:hypothetical protein